MQSLIKPLMQYLVYPLTLKFVQWVYKKFIKSLDEEKNKEIEKQRTALMKSIENANDDETITALSSVLHKLDNKWL